MADETKSRLNTFWQRVFNSVVIVAVVTALILVAPDKPVAQAATFTIPDGDIAALKAALTASGGSHTINLAPNGRYSLSTVDNTDHGANALPPISTTVTINGNGAMWLKALQSKVLEVGRLLLSEQAIG